MKRWEPVWNAKWSQQAHTTHSDCVAEVPARKTPGCPDPDSGAGIGFGHSAHGTQTQRLGHLLRLQGRPHPCKKEISKYSIWERRGAIPTYLTIVACACQEYEVNTRIDNSGVFRGRRQCFLVWSAFNTQTGRQADRHTHTRAIAFS